MSQVGGGRRGLAFAGLVAVLAAVGIFLTLGPSDEGGTAEPVGASQADGESDRREEGTGALPPVPRPTGSLAPFDIYSYLPMSKEELAAAADVAERFVEEHGTYKHDEDPVARARRVSAYATGELGGLLTRTITAPGTVERDRADQIVAKADAKLKEIRKVDRTSVILVVRSMQNIESKNGPADRAEEYAVTLTQVGAEWRVFDLQPAGDGQEGDNEH
ncbi:hypothetical protein [Sinosporangium siamense]|uniref:Uncharacterized protein n=1 Tax=Sinosporangium siamense TaxID=1367973 RepID=A0A919RGE1_9ACTN|nr:hypothetical protein [Sinosporangium siamense]GII93143.1 hypothetical protein Ssi02_33740 [Sinosporangium siamense]